MAVKGSGAAYYLVRDPMSATGSCSCPRHLQMGICKHRVRVLQHLYPAVAANAGGLLRRYLGQLFGSSRGGYVALRAVVASGVGQAAVTPAAWSSARRPTSAISVPLPIKADAKAQLVQGMAAAASHFTAQASGATTARKVAALEQVLASFTAGIKRLAAADAAGAPQPMPVVDQTRKRKQTFLDNVMSKAQKSRNARDARKRRGGSSGGGGNQENMPPQPQNGAPQPFVGQMQKKSKWSYLTTGELKPRN